MILDNSGDFRGGGEARHMDPFDFQQRVPRWQKIISDHQKHTLGALPSILGKTLITRDGGAHLSSARKLYRYIEEAQFANFKREGGRLWK